MESKSTAAISEERAVAAAGTATSLTAASYARVKPTSAASPSSASAIIAGPPEHRQQVLQGGATSPVAVCDVWDSHEVSTRSSPPPARERTTVSIVSVG
jgi:hypothetical protein